MHNLFTLILILTPLFIGFAIPSRPRLTAWADIGLRYLVFVILTLIGIELAQVEGLSTQLGQIIRHVLGLAVLTISFGLAGLMLFDRLQPWDGSRQPVDASHRVSIRGSLIQVSCVGLGLLIGWGLPESYLPPSDSMTALLMLLILLVGIGLKGSGITLKEVLLNKRGVQISVIFTVSVLLAGLLYAALMPDVGITQGLALASGFGWYSLSAIVMTDAYGAVWGSIALFNDLLREFVALLFIPVFMRRYPSAAVGLGGATSLDFTLPVIQQSGGLRVVPLAISFGFIINIIAPVLMVLFASF